MPLARQQHYRRFVEKCRQPTRLKRDRSVAGAPPLNCPREGDQLHSLIRTAYAAAFGSRVSEDWLRRRLSVWRRCRPTAFQMLLCVRICLVANFVATPRISRGERIEARLAAKSRSSRITSMNRCPAWLYAGKHPPGPSTLRASLAVLTSSAAVRADSFASARLRQAQ
jgi:hypothetical protein